MIQHDKRWMEASDLIPFPSLNASITAALAELRRELAPLTVGQGNQGTSCISAPSCASS